MLKSIRVYSACFFFALLMLLFLDFTGTVHLWFGWMAKINCASSPCCEYRCNHWSGSINSALRPCLLFGSLPLGIFQDGVSNISARRKGKKSRFRYSPAVTWLRYLTLVLFIVALGAGISVVVSLLDPYAAYGRIASNLFAPVYRLGNNLLAFAAERVDSYAFYTTDVWIKGWITFGIATLTLIIVGILAWRHGRTYCNTICPVGTILGFFSNFALFRVVFDEENVLSARPVKVCASLLA